VRDLAGKQQKAQWVVVAFTVPDFHAQRVNPRLLKDLQDDTSAGFPRYRPEDVPIGRLPRSTVLAQLDLEELARVDTVDPQNPQKLVGFRLDLGMHIPSIDFDRKWRASEQAVVGGTRQAAFIEKDPCGPHLRRELGLHADK
jgi:hypothetical protein